MYSDSHSHINGYTESQLAVVMEEARAKGVGMVVGVGSNLEASMITIRISRLVPGLIPAVGVHPWWATPLDEEALAQLRQLATQKEVAAIGEVGIDLEREPSTRDLQWQIFRQQVALAQELHLPLILHCRGDRDEVLDLLRSQAAVRGVLHGFGGDQAEAQAWLDLGLYIGIGLRGFTRSHPPAFEQAVRAIPLDRMLLETDSSARSYTSEEGLHPARVLDVAQAVARLHGTTAEEVGRLTTNNLKSLLGR
ncbi:MAG: TatD family hydrolase [Dehalococcoidia bacterium]|nr:TatD family hydrolase [Dehalococcoidia bacterium]